MFMQTCTLDGSHCFLLNLTPEPSARAASASADPVDLKDLPKEYHDFADVFIVQVLTHTWLRGQ
jgi:hypothetical protein